MKPERSSEADGERPPHRAEQDLLVGPQAAQPDAVDMDPVDLGAASPVQSGRGGVRDGAEPSGLAGGGDPASRRLSGA